MASDTSLVFNLVARDRASEQLGSLKEKFSSAGTAIGAALGVGVGASFVSAMDVEAANDKLAAQLGVGQAEADRLAKVSANVYKDAWGESTEDVNDAIRGVYQNIGDVSKAKGGLQGVTEKVIALRDTFDQDLGGVTSAVGQMLKTGLAKNADEAMDIVTKGFQSGVNKADDFLDTLNEYGTQFRDLGLDGATATGILKQGLEGGARDADLVADAMKELNIRVKDQSAAKALKTLGLNAHDMSEAFNHGGPKARQALQTITDKLRAVKDPTERFALAQQLLGTQSEDLSKALYSIDPSTAVKGLGDVSGAADKMTKTLGDNPKAALEGFQRTATMATTQVAGHFVEFAMKNKEIFGPLAGILAGVAVAILAVSVAQKVYATYTAIASAVQAIWNAEIWASTAALFANPVTWVVIGIIALIAAIVLIATKTHWFQTIWSTVWGGLKTAFHATVAWFKGLFAWFGTLPGKFRTWFEGVRNAAVVKLVALVAWVGGLPGRLLHATASLGASLAARAFSAFQSMRNAAVDKALSLISWMRGLPGKARGALGALGSYLYNSGRALLQGFVNGIKNMGGAVKNAVSGVLHGARNLLPFSPAKEGPFSGSGWTLYSGRSVVTAFAQGIQDRAGLAHAAMADAVGGAAAAGRQGPVETPMTPAMAGAPASARPVVRVIFDGKGEPFMQWLKERIRVEYGGDVTNLNGGR